MSKLVIIIGIVVISIGAIVLLQLKRVTKTEFGTFPTGTITPSDVSSVSKVDSKQFIASFFNAVADKRISEAISMMTLKTVPDDSTKQAWGVQLNAFKKLLVTSIEPSMQDSWTDSSQSYKVTMDVEMTPESANGPIPYYGYENGKNIRWVNLEKENGAWKVAGISTGP